MSAAALLISAATVLAGCASMSTPDSSTIGARPSPASTERASISEPTHTPFLGVMATGRLESADGTTVGTVTITAESKKTVVTLSGYRPASTSSLQFFISPYSAINPCPADRFSLDSGALSDRSTQKWVTPDGIPGNFYDNDPTFLKTAVIGESEGSVPDSHGCVVSPEAVAQLTWMMPATHESLDAEDSGPRPDAMGSSFMEDEKLVTYTVASGDTVSEIAARFGITVGDLYYLNPYDASPDIEAGEVLNLSRADRGIPPS